MNKFTFFLGITFLIAGSMSCSNSQELVESPSFIYDSTHPSKPSFVDDEIYAEYYQEGYDTLAVLDTTPATKPSVKPWLIDALELVISLNFSAMNPNCFSMGYGYDNYFAYNPYYNYGYQPYGYDPFGNFNYGINNTYGNCMIPSYWSTGYYNSMHSYNYYCNGYSNYYGNGTYVNNYPQSYTRPAMHYVYSTNSNMLPKPKTRPNPTPKLNDKSKRLSSYARPIQKRAVKATTSNLVTKSSYNYDTKKRNNTKSGQYVSPRTAPSSYSSGSTSQGSSSRGSSTNSGNYTPTKSSTTRSTPTRSTPTRSTPTKSYPTRATPTRSTPTRSTPTRSTPTRYTPTRSTPTRSTPTRTAPSRSTPARTNSSSRSSAPAKTYSSPKPAKAPARSPSRSTPARPSPR